MSIWIVIVASVLSLGAGFSAGLELGEYITSKRLKDKITNEVEQAALNKKRLQLDRNGRKLPKRPDADVGASRIHHVRTSRSFNPKRRG